MLVGVNQEIFRKKSRYRAIIKSLSKSSWPLRGEHCSGQAAHKSARFKKERQARISTKFSKNILLQLEDIYENCVCVGNTRNITNKAGYSLRIYSDRRSHFLFREKRVYSYVLLTYWKASLCCQSREEGLFCTARILTQLRQNSSLSPLDLRIE